MSTTTTSSPNIFTVGTGVRTETPSCRKGSARTDWFSPVGTGIRLPRGKRGKCLKKKLEDKFNDRGWFTCKTDETGAYSKICFGEPMTFDNWIKLVGKGIVFFDSGMYQGNKRPYSQWRVDNGYWNSLITETFD